MSYPVLRNRHNSVCNDYLPKILLLPVKQQEEGLLNYLENDLSDLSMKSESEKKNTT